MATARISATPEIIRWQIISITDSILIIIQKLNNQKTISWKSANHSPAAASSRQFQQRRTTIPQTQTRKSQDHTYQCPHNNNRSNKTTNLFPQATNSWIPKAPQTWGDYHTTTWGNTGIPGWSRSPMESSAPTSHSLTGSSYWPWDTSTTSAVHTLKNSDKIARMTASTPSGFWASAPRQPLSETPQPSRQSLERFVSNSTTDRWPRESSKTSSNYPTDRIFRCSCWRASSISSTTRKLEESPRGCTTKSPPGRSWKEWSRLCWKTTAKTSTSPSKTQAGT